MHGRELLQLRFPSIIVIAVVIVLASRHARCQQISPFEGQGVDPSSANVTKGNTAVYLNLMLQKLVEVNGKHTWCMISGMFGGW